MSLEWKDLRIFTVHETVFQLSAQFSFRKPFFLRFQTKATGKKIKIIFIFRLKLRRRRRRCSASEFYCIYHKSLIIKTSFNASKRFEAGGIEGYKIQKVFSSPIPGKITCKRFEQWTVQISSQISKGIGLPFNLSSVCWFKMLLDLFKLYNCNLQLEDIK